MIRWIRIAMNLCPMELRIIVVNGVENNCEKHVFRYIIY
jgi:hypothetical protein